MWTARAEISIACCPMLRGTRNCGEPWPGAYLKLGDIQGQPFTVSLGDTDGALVSYRKAETLAVKGDPKDWELLSMLVRARRTIAQIDARAGRYAEAVALLQSALEPARLLAQNAPVDFLVDGNPAAALPVEVNWTLGYVMIKQNASSIETPLENYERARTQLQLALRMAEELQTVHPEIPSRVGKCSMYLGFALEGLGDLTGDLKHFEQGAAAQRRGMQSACGIAEKDANPQTRRNCADAFGEWSWALRNAKDGEQAMAAARESLARMQPVAAAEPNSAEVQEDLATAYFHLGAAENVAGRFADALKSLRQAESVISPLEREHPNDPLETMKLLVLLRLEMGRSLTAAHQGAAALALL